MAVRFLTTWTRFVCVCVCYPLTFELLAFVEVAPYGVNVSPLGCCIEVWRIELRLVVLNVRYPSCPDMPECLSFIRQDVLRVVGPRT